MMAFAGHSPTRAYPGPGSPTRALNGFPESQPTSTIYGHPRSMLPPSPQHYQPRFPATTLLTPLPTAPPSLHDARSNPILHKRPGSSMSISSMLGGEHDRSHHESRSILHTRTPSQPAPTTAPFSTGTNHHASPSRYSSKPGYHHDYPYKPRSQTPDKFSTSFTTAPTRQRSSSSGMAMQRPGMLDEPHNRSAASTPAAGFHDPFITPLDTRMDDRIEANGGRRTSLSGVLHRPNSQPQNSGTMPQLHEIYPPAALPLHHYDRNPPLELPKQNGVGGLYDTKPPGMNGNGNYRPVRVENVSPSKSLTHSASPELQRPSLNGLQGRGFAGILNGPTSQPAEPQSATSQKMMRQDSAQSQSDRSVFGERTKFRAYSPFNSSFTSNPDDLGRKGSDDLSHHRAILSLAQENKRGRYSPLPQAVQGAQAQSPVPDAGAKSDRGRVFSGIGGGISTTPTPGGMPSSPFKRDEAPMRLSEDNLKTLSRAASGPNKRSRKTQQDDSRNDLGGGSGEKPNGRKRGKHQHSYKADLEEMAQAGFPSRTSSMSAFQSIKRTSTPSNMPGPSGYYQSRVPDTLPSFRSRKVIHVAGVFDAVAKKPRKHLGNFTYRPSISQGELSNPRSHKFDVSITPNLLPSFTDPDNINCTYTVHVSRLWLQSRERGLISGEHHVWGSGIYTDDSDPVTAAMHAGFLKASFAEGVDVNLLTKIVQDQNPRVEFPKSVGIPSEPMAIVENKDLKLTMVVLPLLERYEGSNRYGIRSRTWPEIGARTAHDGVSFGILRAEFIDMGVEEMRIGRTGHERRERLRLEMQGRCKGLDQRRQTLEAAKRRRVASLRRNVNGANPGVIPRSVPATTKSNQRVQGSHATGYQAQALPVSA